MENILYHGFEIEQNECGFFNVPSINCFSTPTVASAQKAIDAYAVRNGEEAADDSEETYIAVCETQSYGHYREFDQCDHVHRSEDEAIECARRWERREDKIRKEQGTLANGVRFVVRKNA